MAIFTDSKTGELIFGHIPHGKPPLENWEELGADSPEDTATGFSKIMPAIGTRTFDGQIFISGKTSSGKSVFINHLILNDIRKRPVFVFTDLDEFDKSFFEAWQTGRMRKVTEDDEMAIKDPVGHASVGELEEHIENGNVIFIFDDVDKRSEEIRQFRDRALQKGRHNGDHGIIVICVTHKTQNWHETNAPDNEARYIVTFPGSNLSATTSYLHNKQKFDYKTARKLTRLAASEGDYMIFHNFNPVMFATEKSIIKF